MIKFLIIRSLDHNQWNDQEDVRQVSFQDPALQKPEVKALIITTTTIIIITIVIIIIIIVIIIVIIIIIIVIIIVLIIIIIDSIKKVLFCPGRFSLFICPILGNIKRDLFVDLWFRKCKYIYWSNRSRYLFHEKKNCRLTITFMQEHGFDFLDGFESGRDINTGLQWKWHLFVEVHHLLSHSDFRYFRWRQHLEGFIVVYSSWPFDQSSIYINNIFVEIFCKRILKRLSVIPVSYCSLS